MFVGVVYQNFGGAIGEYFDDIADAHLAEQNAQEMAMVQAMKSTQAAHQRQTEIPQISMLSSRHSRSSVHNC